VIKVLLLADTHLGFDLPARPRVERRRRGEDFFTNTWLALEPALRRKVDLVVHGGDLLYRSKVPPRLVAAALEPLLEVADAGVPVMLVPGNHERSALPYPLLASHANLHVFDHARTVELNLGSHRVAVAGFPCDRETIRDRFRSQVAATGVLEIAADIRVLCLHQTVEGSRVEGYTFRTGRDVVRGRDIPSGIAAVLCGHIHRSQVLTHDLQGRPLAAPVLYPGSVERTSFAERCEPKGFLILDLKPDAKTGGALAGWRFQQLSARPMLVVDIDADGLAAETLERRIAAELAHLPDDAVVQLRIGGSLRPGAERVIRAANIRRLQPATMTVSMSFRTKQR
jgi:exonuclease SbcD